MTIRKNLGLAVAALLVIPGALILGDKLGPHYPGQSTYVDLPPPYTAAEMAGIDRLFVANAATNGIPMDYQP